MVISRQLAHKILNGLQVIVSATELNRPQQVIDTARELGQLVSAHTETPQQEKARKDWEKK